MGTDGNDYNDYFEDNLVVVNQSTRSCGDEDALGVFSLFYQISRL
jgi:hypothetical protein